MFNKKSIGLIFVLYAILTISHTKNIQNDGITEDQYGDDDVDTDVDMISGHENKKSTENIDEYTNDTREIDNEYYEYEEDYYVDEMENENNKSSPASEHHHRVPPSGGNNTNNNNNNKSTSDDGLIQKYSITTSTTTTIKTLYDIDIPINEYDCPVNCKCTDGTLFVNCSNQNLTNIPINLPSNTLQIDLSYNLIESLKSNQFTNCTDLRKIYLNNNQIKSIDVNTFDENERLEYINLAKNQLRTINVNTFSNVINLIELNLNENPLEIPSDSDVFLNAPKLTVLSMVACNLTELYDFTFANLSELSSLNLANNTFEEMNINAFDALIKLEHLKIPNMSEDDIYKLCTNLKTIDVISFDNYNISCYELTSGSTFEESTIKIGPITKKPIESATTESSTTIRKKLPEQTTKINRTKMDRSQNSTIINKLPDGKNQTTMAPTTTTINPLEITTNQTLNVRNVKEANVGISTNTINNILIGIIIIAVIGLAIGLVFRRDICGIKTKLCRTRRPPPTDQVRPAEEVPLNKI